MKEERRMWGSREGLEGGYGWREEWLWVSMKRGDSGSYRISWRVRIDI